MNALVGVGYASLVVYCLVVDGTYFKIYFGILAVYHFITQILLIHRPDVTKRKNVMISTWSGKYP